MKKTLKKMLTAALALCLCLSCMVVVPAYAEENDTLNTTMDYLVEECGPRLYGTPNEAKAAAYMKAQFESFGYTDVQWVTPELSSASYVGQLTFSDGIADIYGNCYPSSFEKITAKLVNVGAAEAVVLPEGTSGEIIAAATFDGSISADVINSVVDQITAANAEVTVKGVLLAKKDSITVNAPNRWTTPNYNDAMAALNNSAIPCVVTTDYFLQKAITNADKLTGMQVCTRTETNAVIATKPAATDDPDAIIIVTAHLDSVIAAPGASDNATGSAALLELAKQFSAVDNGNIKLIFGSVGAEEGGGMLGSMYIINSLTPEEKAIAINLNMDMLGAIQPDGDGDPLNAVSMDIYCGKGASAKTLTLNLPAYLVTNGAKNITWAEGIENVRIFKYGSSDHQKFQEAGIDAASMIVVTNEDDDIESINHTSDDTIGNNYSYERLKMCTGLMANGIQTAIDKQLSKKANLTFAETAEGWTAALSNGQQLMKLYDKVEVTLTEQAAAAEEGAAPASVTLTFTADTLTQTCALDPTACTITSVGSGTGVADNLDAARNEQLKNFAADLVVKSEVHKLTKTEAKAATYTAEGNIEYYTCSVCSKIFADAKGEKAITAADTVTAKLPAVVVDKAENKEEVKVELKEEAAEEVIDKALEEAKAENKAPSVVIDVHKDTVDAVQKEDAAVKEEEIKVTEVSIPTATVEKVAEADKKSTLAVNLTTATIIMDNKAMEAVVEQAAGDSVSLVVTDMEVSSLKPNQQNAVHNKKVALTISAELVCNTTGEKIATKDAKGFGGGTVTMAVPLPEELPEGIKASDLKVYFVADDGTVEHVPSKLDENGNIIFDLKHFSEYVIAADAPAAPSAPATGDHTNLTVLYGMMMLSTLAAAALVLQAKKQKA